MKSIQSWTSNSEKREARIYRSFNIFVVALSLLFIVGGAYTFLSVSSLKSDIREDMKIFKENISTDMVNYKSKIINELTSDLDRIKVEIKKKIDDEFNRDNIKEMVENTAEQRIDLIADEIIKYRINSEITSRVQEINIKIDEIFNRTELQLIYLEASNDSRQAYNRLNELSKQMDYSLRSKAKELYLQIYNEYKSPVYYYTFLVSGENLPNFNEMGINEIKELMEASNNESRATILNEVWGKNNLSFEEKMIFYKEVIETDKSINVTRSAAQIVINQNKLDYNPMQWDEIISFLKNNFK